MFPSLLGPAPSPSRNPVTYRLTVPATDLTTLRDGEFDVMIVPFTWDRTNLHELRPRDRVNLECDMVGKYVVRATQIALAEK